MVDAAPRASQLEATCLDCRAKRFNQDALLIPGMRRFTYEELKERRSDSKRLDRKRFRSGSKPELRPLDSKKRDVERRGKRLVLRIG